MMLPQSATGTHNALLEKLCIARGRERGSKERREGGMALHMPCGPGLSCLPWYAHAQVAWSAPLTPTRRPITWWFPRVTLLLVALCPGCRYEGGQHMRLVLGLSGRERYDAQLQCLTPLMLVLTCFRQVAELVAAIFATPELAENKVRLFRTVGQVLAN